MPILKPILTFAGAAAVMTLGTLPIAAQSTELRAKSTNAAALERTLPREGRVRVIVQYLAPVQENAFATGANGLAEARAAVAGALAGVRAAHAPNEAAVEQKNLVALDHLPILALNVTKAELQALARDSRVVRIWDGSLVNARRAQISRKAMPEQAGGGAPIASAASANGMLVAVLAAGIDGNHPALKDRVEAEFCVSTHDPKRKLSSLCPNGKQIQGGAGSAKACTFEGDSDCHMGTAAASIVAGDRQSGAVGVAAGARIISVQVYSKVDDLKQCESWGIKGPCVAADPVAVLRALDVLLKASSEGMKNLTAVTSTIGFGQHKAACEDSPYRPLIEALRKQNVAFVALTGDGASTEAANMPGCVTASVTVGAATGANAIAPFSNMAEWVDLLAPGADQPVAIVGGKMVKAGSTSFAAAHVAGAFAVIRAQRPQATLEQIEAALKSTGVAVKDARPAAKSAPAGRFAAPLIRIDAALAALGAGASPPVGAAQPQPAQPTQPAPVAQPPRPAVNCADPAQAGQSALTSGTNDPPACR